LINSKFGCGYLLGKLASEISEEQPHIHQRIVIGFDTWTTAVAKCLEDARERLPATMDLKALSTFVLAVMEGAVAQARAHQSVAPFDTAVQQCSTTLLCSTHNVIGKTNKANYTRRKTQKDAPARKAEKTRRHRRKEHRKPPRRSILVVLSDVLGKCFQS
jgi:Tetracyclin repressor-like, C-terminal domain